MWFLLSRYRQLSESLPQQDLFRDGVVIDYLFAKDRVFATVNLDDKELALYDTIARILDKDIPPPDYVVYLQASTETLMKRIEKRGRPFEFNMDFHYTDALNRAFNHFFFHYTASPLLIINTNNIDMADLDERDELIDEILRARPGCNYYQPLASAEHSWLLKKSKDREAKGRGEEGEIGGQEDIVL
jgi:deoxyadenosine/deoxycytidine kinase